MAVFDAIRRGDKAAVEKMLQKDPRVVLARHDCLQETPLHEAVDKQNLEMVRLLLQHGARYDTGDAVSDTPLHKAACIGLPAIVQEFLLHHADATSGSSIDAIRTCAGRTALHVACERCHDDCARLLLAAGAGVNVQDRQGFTPLHIAAGQYSLKVVQVLLDAKADLDIEAHNPPHHASKTGKAPVHYAMAFHKPAHTREMISRLPDERYQEVITGYMDYALDIGALDCHTCNMVGIILESAKKRLGGYEVFLPVVRAQVSSGNVNFTNLPYELKNLIKENEDVK